MPPVRSSMVAYLEKTNVKSYFLGVSFWIKMILMNTIRQNLVEQIALYALLMLSFWIQFEVIAPFEETVFPHEDMHYASLIFLPHGVKILAAFLLGIKALPVIFLARFTAGIFILDAAVESSFMESVFSCVAIMTAIALVNISLKKHWHQGVFVEFSSGVSLFKLFMIAVLLSTFFNMILHSAYYHIEGTVVMPVRYIIGDLVGSTIVFTFLMSIRKKLFRMITG